MGTPVAKAANSKPAKPSAPRLKVYQAAFGFYDTVIAAPNQGEALKAWGVRQNLFSEGAARLADDPLATKAALAHPGEPLRRAIGSSDPYKLDPDPPAAPAARKPHPGKTADRAALTAAEAALKAAQQTRAEEAADIQQRRKNLDQEERRAKARWAHEEEADRRTLDKARRAFIRDGGDPKA